MFHNIRRWLNGTFTCVRCGSDINIMSFGFGASICPSCYVNESPFLFLDTEYWLNRMLTRLYKREVHEKTDDYDEILLHEAFIESELSTARSSGFTLSSK
jgi:hypothetical protein